MTQQAGPITITAEQNRERALELRIAGKKYREIARELGLAVSTVHESVGIALKEIRDSISEKAVEMRDIELARCEAIHAAHWEKVGEPAHASVILRTMQRRADLLGLDAPKNIKIGGDGTPVLAVGVDMSKLTTEQLLQLEAIHAAASVQLDPGSPPPSLLSPTG